MVALAVTWRMSVAIQGLVVTGTTEYYIQHTSSSFLNVYTRCMRLCGSNRSNVLATNVPFRSLSDAPLIRRVISKESGIQQETFSRPQESIVRGLKKAQKMSKWPQDVRLRTRSPPSAEVATTKRSSSKIHLSGPLGNADNTVPRHDTTSKRRPSRRPLVSAPTEEQQRKRQHRSPRSETPRQSQEFTSLR